MEGSGKGRTFQVKQKPGVMDFSERQGAWHSVCRGKREFWQVTFDAKARFSHEGP